MIKIEFNSWATNIAILIVSCTNFLNVALEL